MTPSGSLASVSARNSRHLWTTVSDASGFAAKSRVAACAATMASDSGRRPKGVVECVLHDPLPRSGKRNLLAETAPNS